MLSRKFLAVAVVSIIVPLSGCGNQTVEKKSPYKIKPSENVSSDTDPYIVETIRTGDFIEHLPDGIHKLTVPAEDLGQTDDLNLLIIKDEEFSANGKSYFGIVPLPDDRSTEHAQQPQGPQ